MNNKEKIQKEIIRSLGIVTEQLNDAIIVTNLKNEITYTNKSFQTLYGYSNEEIMGRSPDILNAEPLAKQIQSEIYSTVAYGKTWKGEVINRRKDGSTFDCELVIFPLTDEKGKIFAYAGNQRDVSERKNIEKIIHEKEERFRSLVETTSDWIWEINENTLYTYVSPKIRDILGYEPEEILGKTPFDLMLPEEAKRILDIFGSIAASRKSFDRLENTNVHKNGHLVVLETSGVPIFSSDGIFSGYRGIDRDITESKKAEQIIINSQKKLRKQKKALEQKTATLTEILEQINVEKEKIKKDVADNVERILLPILSNLSLSEDALKYKELLAYHLKELASSFGHDISQKNYNLTMKEIEICTMIKGGLTNKEICKLLHISLQTVEKHRKKIRKKIGLTNKKINLASFLHQI